MGIFRKNKKEDSIWTSISDVMSGLMIVFLFTTVLYCLEINSITGGAIEKEKKYNDTFKSSNSQRQAMFDGLKKLFKDKEKALGITIDYATGTVKFEGDEVYFEQGKPNITPAFQAKLNQFFPDYIDYLYNNYKDKIKEIRIEGHTSSTWGNESGQSAFFKNMELSQGRTREVMNYVMNVPSVGKYKDWLLTKVTANGLSSSRLIKDSSGKEDQVKSRRVEFRIETIYDEELIEDLKSIMENKK
ncbi:MAG: OmpA family protein [Clostridium sp.]